MRSKPSHAILLATLFVSLSRAADPATQPADMPVKSVTLFSSGVGYFEHFGTVNGDGSTELSFKTDQINDVLKSLVLQDLDGGHVSAVQYASADPVDKTLKSFQVDLTGNPPMADLLNQLRGAKVSLDIGGGEPVNGTILGVESRMIPVTPPAPPANTWVVNLIDGADLKSFQLEKILGVHLADRQLAADFARALAALAASRDQDKKPVSIRFTGQGDRRVKLGYVVASPVWKTSYRLVLGDKETKIQGWAIVENQTDNDWKNIQLSLVSGRPISFQMDLYQPLYLERPTVQLDLFKNLRPQMYGGGMEQKAMRAATPAAAEADKQSLFSGGQDGQDGSGPTFDLSSSVQGLASGSKLGELFRFTVGDVSLPRQSSAMIPIVADTIGAERLSIFNASVLPRNALNGVMLDNTTGKHLLQGPVTVYDAGGYSGDATVDNLPPGQKRLLSYGVDLDLLFDVSPQSTTTIVSGKVIRGVLIASRKMVDKTQYSVQSKSDHDKTVIVEHPINGAMNLENTVDPMEKTDRVYRFRINAPKGGNATLTVTESLISDQEVRLLDLNDADLIAWSKQGELPQKIRDVLVQAIKLRKSATDLSNQSQQKKQELDAISTEQTRLRENMKTVDKGSQYYNRLMTKLNDQETQIEKLQGERDDLQTKANDAKKVFEDYLANLDIQ